MLLFFFSQNTHRHKIARHLVSTKTTIQSYAQYMPEKCRNRRKENPQQKDIGKKHARGTSRGMRSRSPSSQSSRGRAWEW